MTRSGAPRTVLVNQRTALEILGLSRQQFLSLVRAKSIRHARVGRLVVVRLDEFLAALGLADAAVTAPQGPEPWSPDALRRRIFAGGRRARTGHDKERPTLRAEDVVEP
jgi:hypothetical protein